MEKQTFCNYIFTSFRWRCTILAIMMFFQLPYLHSSQGDYPSREEVEYYHKQASKKFIPLDSSVVVSYKPSNSSLDTLTYYTEYIKPFSHKNNKLRYENQIKDALGINKRDLLKYEDNGSIEVVVYSSSEFESFQNSAFGYSGIWIAIKEKSSQKVKKYYTGLVQNKPIHLKWYSALPLIKNDSTFQIEACLMRQISPFNLSSGEDFELIQDGLIVSFDLASISRDSDNDGLTDIIEKKLFTDVFDQDTDGDGIHDYLDLNPRKNIKRTIGTLFFERIINNGFDGKPGRISCSEDSFQKKGLKADSMPTILIVTDDSSFMSIEPTNKRIIFLTSEEFAKEKMIFGNELNSIEVSPLFKVEYSDNTYKVNFSESIYFCSFIVEFNQNAIYYEMINEIIY